MPLVKVVILVGGPSLGTRFRPLSLDVPKPLFPLAGKPLLWQHFRAIAEMQNFAKRATVQEVLLVGFYDFGDERWSSFLDEVRREFFLNIRTVHEGEDMKLGTGGGLKLFRADVEKGDPEHIFVMHGDVVCDFPLYNMFDTHLKHEGACTILGTRVPKEEAGFFGALGLAPEEDPSSEMPREVLHYAEKAQTFVNDVINCGVYVFRRAGLYAHIDQLQQNTELRSSYGMGKEHVSLELDIVSELCGNKQVYLHHTEKFWMQIKSAGMAVGATQALLNHLSVKFPHELQKEDGAHILGHVHIDKSAKVDPSAKIGPDVVIGPGCVVGPGVRIRNSLLLDGVTVEPRACVLNSIVGWSSTIGKWARIEGVIDLSRQHDPAAGNIATNCGMAVLGADVSVAPGSVLRKVIALPHKSLSGIVENQVLL